MKQILYFFFLFFNLLSFGQIGDPTPNFDIESAYEKPVTPGDRWDFSKKPYKKITSFENNKCIDVFDSIGRHTSRSVFWDDFTVSTLTKYKGDRIVAFTRKTIYKRDESGKKKGTDQITTTKLNLDKKGNIIEGTSFILTKDSLYKVTAHQYYDSKNRLIKSTDTTGHVYIANFYYSGKNLIRNEEIHQIDAKTKTIIDRTYKYNKDNQIVFFEAVKSLFKNDVLTEKKSYRTVEQEYKNKLLVKKTLKDDSQTIERNYTYDNLKNLTTFIETKKNNYDGLITAQMKRTKKYENNILVYSEVQEGLGTDSKFSFTYYFHSEDESLTKTESTNGSGNFKVEYFYNEYHHLIKTRTTIPGKSYQHEVVYQMEYY